MGSCTAASREQRLLRIATSERLDAECDSLVKADIGSAQILEFSCNSGLTFLKGKYFKLLSIENKPYLKSYESKGGRRTNGFPLPLQGNGVFCTKIKVINPYGYRSMVDYDQIQLIVGSGSTNKVEQSITDDDPNWSKLLHFKNKNARSTWLTNFERECAKMGVAVRKK